MKIPNETMLKLLKEEKILPYEDELIEILRDISFEGLPASVVLLFKDFCRGECYKMSMTLTRAMDSFKLVHGDVNFIVENGEYPNHSWVEKDGFVYDPTDRFKWDKDVYYQLFEPKVREVYDQDSVINYSYYQNFVNKPINNIHYDKETANLYVQYIELCEEEHPTVTSILLKNEIDTWRKGNNVTERYTDEVMQVFKKKMKEFMKQKKKN